MVAIESTYACCSLLTTCPVRTTFHFVRSMEDPEKSSKKMVCEEAVEIALFFDVAQKVKAGIAAIQRIFSQLGRAQ